MAVSTATTNFDNDVLVVATGTAAEVVEYMATGTYPMNGRHSLIGYAVGYDGSTLKHSVIYISYK